MSNTHDNFWQVMRSFSWPDPEPVVYKLYHDQQGRPLLYTMEELDGTYIEIDQSTYIQGSYHVVVQNGKLTQLEPRVQGSRLRPDLDAGVACDPGDVCVIVDPAQPHKKWKKQSNDIN